MKHLGDITKISGYDAPTVNVIIGGSPCQDLSVAGKRAGLSGARSGLFMEQIRIIKEMRDKDARSGRTGTDIRPRFMVWENVPGAFSVNKGRDFAAVLEETIRVAEPEAPDIPVPCKGWTTAGCYMGDGWSVAWRVLDAQYWGVPQRRRRIALVADFAGGSAGEVLFKSEGLSGYSPQGSRAWQGAAGGAAKSTGETGGRTDTGGGTLCLNPQGNSGVGITEDKALALVAQDHGNHYCTSKTSHHTVAVHEQANTLVASDWKDPPVVNDTPNAEPVYIVRRLTPMECERLQGFPSGFEVDVSKMTKDEYIAFNLASGNIIANAETGKVYATRGPGGLKLDEPVELKGTEVNGYRVVSIRNGHTKLQCRVHRIIWISKNGIIPDGYCIDHINNDKKDNRISNLQLLTPEENSHKAKADGLYKCGRDNKASKIDPAIKDEIAFVYAISDLTQRQLAQMYGISKSRINQIIKEVGWTDIGEWTDSTGKKRITSDSARYKALGNSIAIPPWLWVCDQLGQYLGEDKTMASLFDGIGGFPLIWSYLFGKENVLWCSEIDEFPIAVTKKRFGDD